MTYTRGYHWANLHRVARSRDWQSVVVSHLDHGMDHAYWWGSAAYRFYLPRQGCLW